MVLVIKGVKYYPVGSWEANQHKFYNRSDVCANRYYETLSDEDFEAWQEAQDLLSLFDWCPRKGDMVYAKWEDYKRLKGIIQWYSGKR